MHVDKEAGENNKEKEVEVPSPPVDAQETELMKDFHDTTLIPFPQRRRSTTTDERFSKFVDVIQKLYVNIPLLDAMQVPTYAKYLRAILNNKGPLPSTEVIKLMEACSEAILRSSPIKKKDPRCPTIDCSIGNQMLGLYPRGNHRDDDITIVSMTYIMSSVNIHYRQTCID